LDLEKWREEKRNVQLFSLFLEFGKLLKERNGEKEERKE